MDFRDKGAQTQLGNIEAQTGRSLAALKEEVADYGALKHSEKRAHLQERHGLSFVHADTLLLWIESKESGEQEQDILDTIYSGAKAALRPIHDAFIAQLAEFGPYEIAPKKGYVSLRLAKQFCMVGPTTKDRVDIGINARGLAPQGRLRALPAGKLCPLEVSLTSRQDVDDELMGWIRSAWDQALHPRAK
ncbi:DUF5655 domain-containing protein [Devosia aquimaris]|uniref:DUF5655 domain-containing protein n=1 Tax=Devosia aquimaris TaxID=2866214 RepID=UPI001CD1522B|nr:DUF5655 domain-containing protein [Devosia sp. CJK-A8-3]